ncbi:MAG: phage integrase family protein [Bacteroidetes bacterium]|jgi:site-specific recombinase XerD|nr:phage integrase family protein [Bacteroidota bacterium]
MKHLPINNPAFELLYKEFDDYIFLKGYSGGKDTSYAAQVREFLFFIETRGLDEIKKVTAIDVIEYQEYIRERPNQRREGGLSDSMIRHHLYSLRMFFDYLIDMGEVDASPAHLPKFTISRGKQRQVLSVEEIKEVQAACRTHMEKALIATAYGCGLRRTELELLDVNDVILSQGVLIVRKGKGSKSRTIPISDGGIKILREYIVKERPSLFAEDKMESTPAFFINSLGERMKGQYLAELLKVILQRTQNPVILGKEITLHCLRHSIATHLLDNGADIEFVQEFLGHSEIDTSHLYSKRRKQRLKMYNEINRPTYAN